MGHWRLGCQLCCDFWGIAFSRIARVLLMTFADSEASRILRSHPGAEDGGGKPEELQRGGDSTHEGCRGGQDPNRMLFSLDTAVSHCLKMHLRLGFRLVRTRGPRRPDKTWEIPGICNGWGRRQIPLSVGIFNTII